MPANKSAICPDCNETINLGPNPYKGQKFSCPNCWAYLEVINLDPPELAWEVAEEEWAIDDDPDRQE